MEIILREDVVNLGKAGEVVKVRDGYGRNYLLPRKMAMLANASNLKALSAQKKLIEASQAKVKKNAEEALARLSGLEITLARGVGTQDRLFGSVTKLDISNALRQQGIQVDKHLIQLEAPIKTIGTYDVSVKLHPEVTATFKLWVIRETK